jgi:hypothetical protein
MRTAHSTARREFNGSSHGDASFIEDGHKAIFMALTSGEPGFCLTSVYVNGKPGVAIVLVERDDRAKRILLAPCFVSITAGMKLRTLDGDEYEMKD